MLNAGTAKNDNQIPVRIVGSSVFGKYPKISTERTYNMFISDEWLVNYAGFQKITDFAISGEGRGLFHSVRGNFLISVVESNVYKILPTLDAVFVGNLETTGGEVSIDENITQQIIIVDGQFAYILNTDSNELTKQTLIDTGSSLPIIPGYVCYHNTFFLIAQNPTADNPQNWYVFQRDTANTISMVTQLAIQTKPDKALAVCRLPGKGNHVIVFGSTVAEIWNQIGGQENYNRVSSFNIDNGVFSIHTISSNDEFVVWLAQNENNSLSLMITNGGEVKRISSDGIDILLQDLERPDISTSFFYRQDGHLFYQITFFDPADNLTLAYDFNTEKFYHITDENLDFHPARQLVYFKNKIFFVSINDAALYEMSSKYISYNYDTDPQVPGATIPRKRITNTLRKNDNSPYRSKVFSFWLEQGVNNFSELHAEIVCVGFMVTEDIGEMMLTESGEPMLMENGYCMENANRPRIDLSISVNGNQSFSPRVHRFLNFQGNYKNRISWNNLGSSNELTMQLDFWGLQRFVAQDGFVEAY